MINPTVADIKAAIQAYFGDTTRSPGGTKAGLEEIAGEAEILSESISDDADEGDM